MPERVALRTGDRATGAYEEGGRAVGFAATPGYETYAGRGWYGALVQRG